MSPVLVWLREDLRIEDNPALFHAAALNVGVIAIYIIDVAMWQQHSMAACRVEFILRGLQSLSKRLAKLNIPLIIETVSSVAVVPEKILNLIYKYDATALYFNRQYEINEQRRDKHVQDNLQQHQIQYYSYDDQVILPPASVVNQQGEYFKVFTAYKRAWQRVLQQFGGIKLLGLPKKQVKLDLTASVVPKFLPEFQTNISPQLWPAGEEFAQQRLKKFIDHGLQNYNKDRDFPAIDGTSKLSPYLSAGMISARICFAAALEFNQQEFDTGNKGALTWMSELIWRDFYKHILVAVPRVAMGRAYQLATENIAWQSNEKHYLAWQQGQTGFPIIDAAMRQLNQTGWMHNRLRMITAMFLAKNLLLDWRWGEHYFMQHLIDGDLAANNGGWQWSASTGTDAAPYFRIFNPISQSERFDPQGNFIRRYCPELAELDNFSVHDPHVRAPLFAAKINYPKAIVDLSATRLRAIAAFKAAKLDHKDQ